MGRFDALTQLTSPAPPAVAPPNSEREKPASPQDHLPVSPHVEKPAKPQTRKQASPQTHIPTTEEIEKYTTRLEPSLVKRIKLYAVEHDMNDYDVVRLALNDLFAKER